MNIVKGELRSLSARMFNPLTNRYDGKRIKLTHPEFTAPWCGVIWRGKVIPIKEFLRV